MKIDNPIEMISEVSAGRTDTSKKGTKHQPSSQINSNALLDHQQPSAFTDAPATTFKV